ncbi:hypothetical protein ACA910_013606 [Epithemia clementina (nom. ined.)]
MVKSLVQSLESTWSGFCGYLPPGLTPSLASAFIEGGKYLSHYRHEFVGTLVMILCTFSAGKWIGKDSVAVAWSAHALGVVAADYFAGGPHVNPAVTVSMWCLGKCSYTEAYVRISAQMGGGLIAFPLYHALSDALKFTHFGGPEFNADDYDHSIEAFLSEFGATLLLMWVIYILNWELHFGEYHYIIKQTLTAVAIRALIELFPTAGPAMNPMLATSWAVFSNDFEFPVHFLHYFVYWASPFMAAILASVLYVIYAGGTVFGQKLPIGPLKKPISKIKKS